MITTFILFATVKLVKKILLSALLFNKQYSYILKNTLVMKNLVRKLAAFVLVATEDNKSRAITMITADNQDNKKAKPVSFVTYYHNVPVADTKCV